MTPSQERARRKKIAYDRQVAALLYGYGDITLRREGDHAVVEIEYNRKIYPVIRVDLDSNFCETVTPFGIEDEIKRAEQQAIESAMKGKRR